MSQGDRQHFIGCGHFQIDRQADRAGQRGKIIISDMSAIFAQVDGDAVRASRRGDFSSTQWTRMDAAARIADGGDMIDVYAQAQML
jgi:hypothetical protein